VLENVQGPSWTTRKLGLRQRGQEHGCFSPTWLIFAGMNEIYSKYFTAEFFPPGPPSRWAALPRGANVEIEVIAHY